MLRSNKTTQFDGTSYITDGEGNEQNEQTVAYFSATIRTDKTVTMSMTVSNAELYEENKTTVRADYTEFQTAVYTAQDAE